MSEWMAAHATLVWWLVGISAVSVAASLIAVPWMVVRLPADYFVRGRRTDRGQRHPAVHFVITIARNVLGYLFIVMGLAMLVLPGQGVLTILAGLALVDFPGKDRLIQRIVAKGPVRKSLDWIRERAGRPPLVLDR